VLLDLVRLHYPAPHRMALLAIRSEFSSMNVSVTLGAEVAHIGEDGLGMALCASYALVESAQRVPRCIVIELRNCADRLPSIEGMAVLAGDIEGAMRAMRRLCGLRLGRWGH
jgi:hypothetical protein